MARDRRLGQEAPAMVVGEVIQDSLDPALEVRLGENAARANSTAVDK